MEYFPGQRVVCLSRNAGQHPIVSPRDVISDLTVKEYEFVIGAKLFKPSFGTYKYLLLVPDGMDIGWISGKEVSYLSKTYDSIKGLGGVRFVGCNDENIIRAVKTKCPDCKR